MPPLRFLVYILVTLGIIFLGIKIVQTLFPGPSAPVQAVVAPTEVPEATSTPIPEPTATATPVPPTPTLEPTPALVDCGNGTFAKSQRACDRAQEAVAEENQGAADQPTISVDEDDESAAGAANVWPSMCFGSTQEIASTIGGNAADWSTPTWERGAWTYKGPSTQLRWPGFGFFDTWPDHGGSGLTRDFTTPDGDANTSAASFHCVPE